MDRFTIRFYACAAIWFACGSSSIAQVEPMSLTAARQIACQRFDGLPAVVSSVALLADGQSILAASDAHEITVWETATGALQGRLSRHGDWVRAATASDWPAASGAHDRTLQFWGDSQQPPHAPLSLTNAVSALALHPNGQLVAVVGFGGELSIANLSTGQIVQAFECACHDQRAVAFSPDGEHLAAAGRNGRIRIWRLSTETIERDIDTDGRAIRALAFSPNSQTLAVGGDAAAVRLYDVATGQHTGSLEVRPAKVFALAYVTDAALATAGSDDQIRIWDIAAARPAMQLVGHTGTVTSLAVGKDGTTLVSGSYDTTIRVWHLTTAMPASPQPVTADRYSQPIAR
jgi:WD40 repeat protein